MGKHKDKKSKKHKKEKKHKKNKKKSYSSSSSEESGEEIQWCDGTNTTEQSKDKTDQPKTVEEPKSDTVNRDNVDDWLGFFEKTTSDNSKRGVADRQKRKDDIAKEENKVRYARELNPYFKDEKKGEYIDDPEEFYKKKNAQEKEYSSSGSDEDDDDDDGSGSDNEQDISEPLTGAEKNALVAKIIKAEMLGDDELVKELKAKLEKDSQKAKTKVEVYQKKLTKKDLEKSEDSLSVRELFYQTKSMSSKDETMRFVSSSSKLKRTDDEYDEVRSKKKKQKTENTIYERQRQQVDTRCRQCLEETDKQFILKFQSEFEYCFVALSSYETFVPNVCQIRSRDHSYTCSLEADENCWSEIRKAMRNISAFFNHSYGQTVIFMETNFRNEKRSQNLSRKHFVIECVPIKRKYENDARIYFHKAIMECEEEWSQNKKMIKLEEKPITSKLPKGLPYFWVSFGPNFNGFAHVIEDENNFSTNFGTEIISGLLDIDCSKWNKAKRYQSNTTNHKLLKEWRQFISSSST